MGLHHVDASASRRRMEGRPGAERRERHVDGSTALSFQWTAPVSARRSRFAQVLRSGSYARPRSYVCATAGRRAMRSPPQVYSVRVCHPPLPCAVHFAGQVSTTSAAGKFLTTVIAAPGMQDAVLAFSLQAKPAWCQPNTILLSGTSVCVVSDLLCRGPLLPLAILANGAIFLWWYVFLVLFPLSVLESQGGGKGR
jgi:hypothetical protein